MVLEITRFFASRIIRHRDLAPRGRFTRFFYDGFWKSDHNVLIVFHSNFFSGMHSFWDNKVLLLIRYDVIMISSPRGASDDYSGRILKSEHDFLILTQSKFSFLVHGFQDSEVLLQAGYDVTLISPLGGASCEFSCRILEERPWLPDSVPYQRFI